MLHSGLLCSSPGARNAGFLQGWSGPHRFPSMDVLRLFQGADNTLATSCGASCFSLEPHCNVALCTTAETPLTMRNQETVSAMSFLQHRRLLLSKRWELDLEPGEIPSCKFHGHCAESIALLKETDAKPSCVASRPRVVTDFPNPTQHNPWSDSGKTDEGTKRFSVFLEWELPDSWIMRCKAEWC